MAPPLPAASQPSKSTQTGGPTVLIADQSAGEQTELEEPLLQLGDASIGVCLGKLLAEVDGAEACHDSIELGMGHSAARVRRP